MKRFLASAVSALLLFSLTACENSTAPLAESPSRQAEIDESKPSEFVSEAVSDFEAPILIAYFSATGSTENVAAVIAEKTGGTLFKLEPVDSYSSEDLDWTADGSRVNLEHDDESLRSIKLVSTSVENWGEYDTVFIGYPIWWGIAAWPVNEFITSNDFSGKIVIPFCTSASSGIGESATLLLQTAGTGSWQEGHRFSSSASDSEITEWLSNLNY